MANKEELLSAYLWDGQDVTVPEDGLDFKKFKNWAWGKPERQLWVVRNGSWVFISDKAHTWTPAEPPDEVRMFHLLGG